MNASATSGRARTARFICSRTIRPDVFCALLRRSDLSPFLKYKKCPCSDQRETKPLAECDWLAQVEIRECGKHCKGDYFLQGLELSGVVDLIAETIGGHRQAIFNERKTPADQDHVKKRHLLVPQVPIPSGRHEDIGTGQQQYRRQIRRQNGHVILWASGRIRGEGAACSG